MSAFGERSNWVLVGAAETASRIVFCSIRRCCCYGCEASSISTCCFAPPSGAYGPTLSYIILSFRGGAADRRDHHHRRTRASSIRSPAGWPGSRLIHRRARPDRGHRGCHCDHFRCRRRRRWSRGSCSGRASIRPWLSPAWTDSRRRHCPWAPERQLPAEVPPEGSPGRRD